MLALIAKNCPALEELDATEINARPSAFRELTVRVSSLRSISIGRCANNSDLEIGKVFKANKSLTIFNAKSADFPGRSLLKLARDLVRLNLRYTTARGE